MLLFTNEKGFPDSPYGRIVDPICHNVLNSFVHASIIYAVLYVIYYSVKC